MTEIAQRRNLRDLAFEIATITTIVDYLDGKKDELRSEFQRAASEAGADATKAMLDGEEIAKISVVLAKPKAQVIDEKAFLNYVKKSHATEIQESIRESFRKSFIDRLAPFGDQAIDESTGEVFDFIRFTESKPYIATRFQPDGRNKIIEAVRNQKVALTMGGGDEIQAHS